MARQEFGRAGLASVRVSGLAGRVRLIEALKSSTSYLAARGVESPRLEAEWIFGHRLRVPRLQLYLQFERELDAAEMTDLREAIRRRGTREPLQHILGTAEFCGLAFEVNRDVLIPRPETELLAERAWGWLGERFADGNAGEGARVLDWGTGSGCLAVTLAHRCPSARVIAVDVSPAALAVARRNAERHGCSGRIAWVEADGCRTMGPEERFDLVVANPPYIARPDLAGLAPEVREFDPTLALDGGEDGLDFYRRLGGELAERLRPGGIWMAEFGDGQAPKITEALAAEGWRTREVCRDDIGRERFLVAEREG